MSTSQINLEAFLPPIDFEHQSLVFTVPNDYKKLFGHKARFLIFQQKKTNIFIEVKNSMHCSYASLNDETEVQGASISAPSIVENDSQTTQKN